MLKLQLADGALYTSSTLPSSHEEEISGAYKMISHPNLARIFYPHVHASDAGVGASAHDHACWKRGDIIPQKLLARTRHR